MAGEDVQLTYALKWLDAQPKEIPGPAHPAATTPPERASPAIAVVIISIGLLAVIAGRK